MEAQTRGKPGPRPKGVKLVSVSLNVADLGEFDELCAGEGKTRSEGLRELIRARLKAARRKAHAQAG